MQNKQHFLKDYENLNELMQVKVSKWSPFLGPFDLQTPTATWADTFSKSQLPSSLKSIHDSHINLGALIPAQTSAHESLNASNFLPSIPAIFWGSGKTPRLEGPLSWRSWTSG